LGLSLNPNGSKDLQLKIQDLPDITIREWELLEDTIGDSQTSLTHSTNLDFQNPITPFAMELRTRSQTTVRKDLYYTQKEIEEGIPNVEDENDTTDSEAENDIEAQFDSDDDEEFDPEYNV